MADYAKDDYAKDRDIYDVHRRAVSEWHKACQQYEQAKLRRDQLKDEVDKISQEFADYLSAQMQDPTDPRTPPGQGCQPQPPNGQAAQLDVKYAENARIGWGNTR